MQPWWQQPFFQVALPIIVAFVVTYWAHNKRIDDLNRRLDDLNRRIEDLRDAVSRRLDAIERRLERIEQLLGDHERRSRSAPRRCAGRIAAPVGSSSEFLYGLDRNEIRAGVLVQLATLPRWALIGV